jgi:uncharacterized membrane protein
MNRLRSIVLCVVCLLVTVAAFPAFTAGITPAPTRNGGFEDVSIAGPAVIETSAESNTDGETPGVSGTTPSVSVWQSEPFVAHTVLSQYADVTRYRVCAYAHVNSTRSELGCQSARISGESLEAVNVSGLDWPGNASGSQQLSFEVYEASAGPQADPIDNTTLSVTVLSKNGDVDGDGVMTEDELQLGLDPLDADMDRDGLTDGTEVNDYSTSPRSADTDGDGVRDGEEVQAGTDPIVADSDADGVADETELAVGTDPTEPHTTERLAIGASALLYAGLGIVVVRRKREDDEGGDGSRSLPERVPSEALNEALTSDGDPAVTESGSVPEFLTDEDRVLHLLDRNDGRMKQSAIVEHTEWSKAKVSRLLSAMDDEGEIEKLSLGRENVISLDREWIDDPSDADDSPPETVADGGRSSAPER